jgi:hypothetical protein
LDSLPFDSGICQKEREQIRNDVDPREMKSSAGRSQRRRRHFCTLSSPRWIKPLGKLLNILRAFTWENICQFGL